MDIELLISVVDGFFVIKGDGDIEVNFGCFDEVKWFVE